MLLLNENVSTDQKSLEYFVTILEFKDVASSRTKEPSANDWNDRNSPLQLLSDDPQQTLSSPSSSYDNITSIIKNKIDRIISEYPDLFPNSNEDILNNLDQFNSIIKNLRNHIKELENSSITEDYQKQIDGLLHERVSLMEQMNQLVQQLIQQNIEIQTATQPLTTPEQSISRRVFEQEMLALTKESEQLKEYVKQIQIENKKLKDIILKFERIIRNYMHENDRLKQENQQLSYSSNTENSTLSDTNVQSVLINDDNEPYLKQSLIDTERQLKSIRIQNQRLKKQLETLRTSETQYRLEVDRLKADL